MTDERFAELVERYRLEAEHFPTSYRVRVLASIAFGQGFLLAVIALSLIAGGIVATLMFRSPLRIFTGFALGPFVAFALALALALWTPPPPGDGETLTPEDTPELFRLIDEVRSTLRAPRIDRVSIVIGNNASVRMRAAAGLFGIRRELEIGLLMMQSLTPVQLRAVLGHELGHLSRTNDRIIALVHQAHAMWQEVYVSTEYARHPGQGLLHGFLGWYLPYFNAITLALAREGEFAADRAAAEVTSAAITAGTLARIELVDADHKYRVSRAITRRARETPLPIAGALEDDPELTRPVPEPQRVRWMTEAYAARETPTDSHPSLLERMTALGSPPVHDPPGPDSPEATAVRLLGGAAPSVKRALERVWRGKVLGTWESVYRTAVAQREEVARLRERERDVPLDADERFRIASCLAADQPPEEALETFEALLRELPEHRDTMCHVALRRLDLGVPGGFELAERAIATDPSVLAPMLPAMEAHLIRSGRADEIPALHDRTRRRYQEEEQEVARLLSGLGSAALEPHRVPDEAVASLRAALEEIGDVRSAFLCRLPVRRHGWDSVLVLAVSPRPAILSVSARERRDRITHRALEWAPDTGVFQLKFLGPDDAGLEATLEALPGARVL